MVHDIYTTIWSPRHIHQSRHNHRDIYITTHNTMNISRDISPHLILGGWSMPKGFRGGTNQVCPRFWFGSTQVYPCNSRATKCESRLLNHYQLRGLQTHCLTTLLVIPIRHYGERGWNIKLKQCSRSHPMIHLWPTGVMERHLTSYKPSVDVVRVYLTDTRTQGQVWRH